MDPVDMRSASDFWWVTPEEAKIYNYVTVGYQEPYSDEPDSDREPYAVSWYHSFDSSGNLSKAKKRYPLDFVAQWRSKCSNINVFRSISLYRAEDNGEELVGPFLIDVDREDYENGKGYVQNICDALEATRQVVKEYLCSLCKLQELDFRIFFTGHKGFNIEVRPQALDIVSPHNRRHSFDLILREINKMFGSTSDTKFVDKIHDYVRLHHSINRWIGNNGQIMNRMKFKLDIDKLEMLSAEEICAKADELASASLELG